MPSVTLRGIRKRTVLDPKLPHGFNAEKGSGQPDDRDQDRVDFMSQHLVSAAERGDLVGVLKHLDSGADPNYHSKSRGMTALHMAVQGRHAEVVRVLLERGADPNLTGLLAIACHDATEEIIGLLLAAGADPNRAGAGGETPLMVAARFSPPEVLRRFLDAGGDPALVSDEGKSAIDFARLSRWKDNVTLIEEAGGPGGAPEPPTPAPTMPWPDLVEGEPATRSSPEAALWSYIHAMNRWERESARRFKTPGPGQTQEQAMEEILAASEPIVATYCTPRPGRVRHTRFGMLPEYDPALESLEQVDYEKPGRAVMLTRHGRLGKFRYVLLKKAGRWLIDNKKIDLGGTWGKWSL